jgi:hypothetical protein
MPKTPDQPKPQKPPAIEQMSVRELMRSQWDDHKQERQNSLRTKPPKFRSFRRNNKA